MRTPFTSITTHAFIPSIAAVVLCTTLAMTANAAITIRIGETSPGSASVMEGTGGLVSLGVFASTNGSGVTTFDSFDLFFDIGGDGTNTVAPIFSFPANPVIAGAVFTNAAVNPSTDVTSPLANADLQVSADRAPFTFALTETKLFDFIFNVDANASVGDYAVTIRDDSGFLAAINNGGVNLLADQPNQFIFTPGSFSVTAVPEPSTVLFLACAGGAVVFNRFRTRTNKAISRAIA
jgi:hypothetical protein